MTSIKTIYYLIRSIFILVNISFTSSNHNTLHIPAARQMIISFEYICPKWKTFRRNGT